MVKPSDAARALGLTYWQLRHAIRKGALPALQLPGGAIRIEPAALAAYDPAALDLLPA